MPNACVICCLSQPRARMFVSVSAVPVKTHSGKYSCARRGRHEVLRHDRVAEEVDRRDVLGLVLRHELGGLLRHRREVEHVRLDVGDGCRARRLRAVRATADRGRSGSRRPCAAVAHRLGRPRTPRSSPPSARLREVGAPRVERLQELIGARQSRPHERLHRVGMSAAIAPAQSMHTMPFDVSSCANVPRSRTGPPITANGFSSWTICVASALAATTSSPVPGRLVVDELDRAAVQLGERREIVR